MPLMYSTSSDDLLSAIPSANSPPNSWLKFHLPVDMLVSFHFTYWNTSIPLQAAPSFEFGDVVLKRKPRA